MAKIPQSLRLVAIAIAILAAVQLSTQQPRAGASGYHRDIQPILSTNCVGCHAGNAAPAEPRIGDSLIDFVTQIQPILKESCYSCHSGSEAKGGLRLDAKAPALKSRGLIVPGNSKDSLLLHRILGDNGMPRMPLDGAPLTPQQIAIVRAWIDQGALP